MKQFFVSISLFAVFLLAGCKKYLEVGDPETSLTTSKVFMSDATAVSAQLAIYAQLEGLGLLHLQILHSGLSSDEFNLYTTAPAFVDFYRNNLVADNPLAANHWISYYSLIYQSNSILEGLAQSTGISAPVKSQIEGESRFIRAYFYFYLVNLYGDIPIAEGTSYEINSRLKRKPVSEVYAFIIADLEKAVELLAPSYKGRGDATTTERVRPNKYAAAALLARVQLYNGNYSEAERLSTMVIEQPIYQLTTNPSDVFLKNSSEAIWQVMPVFPGFNTYVGYSFILNGAPFLSAFDSNFVKGFSVGDLRKQAWVGERTVNLTKYYYPNKYKVGLGAPSITEYTTVLRLAEQYLIRSEARVLLDKPDPGEADLNVIRQRAGLTPVTGLTRQLMLDAISEQRRYELFTESGDRWFDLKRTGRIEQVVSIIKNSEWSATDALYPIPVAELERNAALHQNPGY